jgi:hypothetical protein
MNNEKVKEIKKALEDNANDSEHTHLAYIEDYRVKLVAYRDILTLINELESENERLNKSDTSKEESSIEYYNLYKDLKRKNKDLNELCELQRVSIAESFVRENQLKDRIAELEERNAKLLDSVEIVQSNRCVYKCVLTKEHLTKFAERLKEELKGIVGANFIDETLKEFMEQ